MAEIEITCMECGSSFEFQGVEPGFRFDKPSMSIDATTLSVPISPHGEKPTPIDMIGYSIRGLQS
jgi:hypothetical protein